MTIGMSSTEAPPPTFVVGAGGHAKVVVSTLQAAGFAVEAIFDDDPRKRGERLCGIPVVGPVEALLLWSSGEGVIAVGDNAVRRLLSERLHRFTFLTIIHPNAWVHPSARLGPGTVVFAGAVVQPDAAIGAHSIVNTGATIDHECRIGDFVHLAPGAHLAGNVRVADGAFLGIGACAVPGVSVGAWSIAGAGAALLEDVAGGTVVAGVPARVLRRRSTLRMILRAPFGHAAPG